MTETEVLHRDTPEIPPAIVLEQRLRQTIIQLLERVHARDTAVTELTREITTAETIMNGVLRDKGHLPRIKGCAILQLQVITEGLRAKIHLQLLRPNLFDLLQDRFEILRHLSSISTLLDPRVPLCEQRQGLSLVLEGFNGLNLLQVIPDRVRTAVHEHLRRRGERQERNENIAHAHPPSNALSSLLQRFHASARNEHNHHEEEEPLNEQHHVPLLKQSNIKDQDK
jgi:hypothetical protein